MKEAFLRTLIEERLACIKRRADLDKEIAAFDVLIEQNNKSASINGVQPSSRIKLPPPEYGEVGKEIKAVINEQFGKFTIPEIQAALSQKGIQVSAASIHSAFARFINKGIIRTIRKGKGRKPSTYKKVEIK